MLNGMDFAEKFYKECEEQIFEGSLAFLRKRTAVGLVGEGSECYGFDDDISRDHDFGPSFCLWLTDEDYGKYGKELADRYADLPVSFMGLNTRIHNEQTLGRVGVLNITEFYNSLIGRGSAPRDNLEWLSIKEYQLSAASNGRVFRDEMGEFSRIRDDLLRYYPEDVRLKRLAAALGNMAQSGQYNYIRCIKRNEIGGAFLMQSRFVKSCLRAIYLLNKEYMPFDKWAFRKMNELPLAKTAQLKLHELIATNDDKTYLIESICDEIRTELRKQNLSTSEDGFLIAHAIEITHNINDIRLKKMNVLQGEI